jgi:phosphoribosylformimino-5-aminoimidazole carboxamide ribotide isomerase
MILIPAIDIRGGEVVRLFQGKFDQQVGYEPHPFIAAKRWHDMGAEWLHVVDLDGAKDGVMINKDHVIYIAEKLHINVQAGGGIRDIKTVEDLLNFGVKRVVLGTRAIGDRLFLKNMLRLHGERICVSLDCSNGFVADRGWVETTKIKATELAVELESIGVQYMVYTDIARDGTLAGPNFEQLQTMMDTVKKVNLIASGGVSSIEDVVKLRGMRSKDGRQLWGAITGKAIYEGKLDFKKAIELLK